MTILEKVCAEYFTKTPYPISFITETDTHWAVFSAAEGDNASAFVPLIDKTTGEMTRDFFGHYIHLPRVPVPASYVHPRYAK